MGESLVQMIAPMRNPKRAPTALLHLLCGGRATAVVILLHSVALISCTGPEPQTGTTRGRVLGSESGVVLPQTAGQALLDQCTRATPRLVRGYWSPSAGMIQELEEALPPVLQAAVREATPAAITPLQPEEYYRQYIGIVRWNGRRTIYVNGFHKQHIELLRRGADGQEQIDTLMWRSRPVTVCDGGSLYFGVEYDPQRGRFSKVRFNQRAG